jgi:rod shape-determining protein MreB
MMIGERSAENLKIQIGCAYPFEEEIFMEIKGRNLLTGLPLNVSVSSNDMLEALYEPVNEIIEAIHWVLEKTPPELSSDVSSAGMYLTGGGALLKGLDRLIQERTGITTRVADNAVECVAIGTGKSLDSIGILEKTMHESRRF